MKWSRSFRSILGILFALVLFLGMAIPGKAVVRYDDGRSASEQNSDYAFVQFTDAPIASYDGSIKGYEATKPVKGQKVDLNSPTAKKYGKKLEAQQENYQKWLAKQLPQVKVVTDYQVTFNGIGIKLNGASLNEVSRGPGVVNTGYSGEYRPAMSESVNLIHAALLWEALGGQANAGAGIKVGVIDTGIDQDHPFLQPNDGMHMPEGFPKGDTSLTTNKVIVAKVFNQDSKLTAKAVQSHGTHVSGTIAGKAGTMPTLGDKPLSGIAPGAYLGNYNIFPGNVKGATSIFIAKAVEEAVKDGMDVLNLSLGGTPHKGADLLDMTVNSAVDAGVVVAVAAGNEGPGNYTVGSPGTADKVITVAATTNSRTFALSLESSALEDPVMATTGSGEGNGEVKEQISGNYVPWSEVSGGGQLACSPIDGTPLDGQIALIQRGACTFTSKINNAAAAGAKAVIIYQNSDDDPIPMATDGAQLPAVMINKVAGEKLVSLGGDRSVTINYPPVRFDTTPNLLADFSSWGPTPNYTLKPDLAAPGVNIYSSVVGGGYELYNGTSMATPHVAGSAAALLALHPDWGPEDIKAALMATANDADGSVTGVDANDPLKVGAGIIDLSRAMNPPALSFPSSLSFGLIRPVGNQIYQLTFTLENPTDHELSYDLNVDDNLALSESKVTLAGGESKVINVTVENRGAQAAAQVGTPDFEKGYINITSSDGNIRVPYLYVIDYNR